MSEDRKLDTNSGDTADQTALSAAELGKIRDALSVRYGLKLEAGELLAVDAERTKEQCWSRVEISKADGSYLLEVECASLPSDAASSKSWTPIAAFDVVVDFLDSQLFEYFEDGRFARWHDDWRLYELDGHTVRFRGRESRPDLEALADQWLATADDADDEKPN